MCECVCENEYVCVRVRVCKEEGLVRGVTSM